MLLNAVGVQYTDEAMRAASCILRSADGAGIDWCGGHGRRQTLPLVTVYTDQNATVTATIASTAPAGVALHHYASLPDRPIGWRIALQSMRLRPRNFQAHPIIWWLRLVALLNAPYELVLMLDVDAAVPLSSASLPFVFERLVRHDMLVVLEDMFPFGASFNRNTKPAPNNLTHADLARFAAFEERNMGLIGWNLGSATSRLVLERLVGSYRREASLGHVRHDQYSLREALFLTPNVREWRCPTHICCRSYIGTTNCVCDPNQPLLWWHSRFACFNDVPRPCVGRDNRSWIRGTPPPHQYHHKAPPFKLMPPLLAPVT